MSWLTRLFAKKEEKPHECVGKVIRCQMRTAHGVDGGPWRGHAREVSIDGTDILMRCDCGRWIIKWMPGVWSVSDFGDGAMDMDRAIRDLTKMEVDDE